MKKHHGKQYGKPRPKGKMLARGKPQQHKGLVRGMRKGAKKKKAAVAGEPLGADLLGDHPF